MKRIILLVSGALLCCNVLFGMDNKRKASAPAEPQAEKKRVIAEDSATQTTSSRGAVQSSSLPISSQDIEASDHQSQSTPSRVVRPTPNQQLFAFCSGRSLQPHLNLLKQGASANSMGDRGISALHEACKSGDIQVVRILLKNGARVNQQTETGGTPLHYASGEGHGEVVKELLKVVGIDMNLRTNSDSTALHAASWYGCIDVVKQLVAAGVDCTIKAGPLNLKKTAEDWARKQGHNEIADYLQQVREAGEQDTHSHDSDLTVDYNDNNK